MSSKSPRLRALRARPTSTTVDKDAQKKTDLQDDNVDEMSDENSADNVDVNPAENINDKADETDEIVADNNDDNDDDDKIVTDNQDESKNDEADDSKTDEVDESKAEEPDESKAEEPDEGKTEESDEGKTEEADEGKTEEAVESLTEKIDENLTEKIDENLTEKIDENSTDKLDENLTEKPDENKTEEPIENSTEEPVENSTEEPDENKTEEPVESSTEEPMESSTDKPDENVADKPDVINSTGELTGTITMTYVTDELNSLQYDDDDDEDENAIDYMDEDENVELKDDESDSDNESRLVIKEEEIEEHTIDDKQDDNTTNNQQDETFNCESCNLKPGFINLADYLDHMKDNHQEKWNLDRHNRSHAGGGPLQCRACNFTADIRQSLTVHELNHHDPPVGNMSKNNLIERMNKNLLKRHNQVGGSDYRDQSKSPIDKLNNEQMEIDDELTSEMVDNTGCIALSCCEKGCPFVTSWDSEMQRHLSEVHSESQSPTNKLMKKPIPMLIPLSPGSKTSSVTSSSSSNEKIQNSLNVPRVRVRPELAKIARDSEIAKLYRSHESSSQTFEKPVNSIKVRDSIFLDKLKDHLNSTKPISGITNSLNDNITINNLKCWCTYQATCQNDYDNHKKTHHTALSVLKIDDDNDDDEDYNDYDDNDDQTRCNKCFKIFDNVVDKNLHIQNCYNEDTSYNNSLELSDQMEWNCYHGGVNTSVASINGYTTKSENIKKRKVFKCPHCVFWAATASRFHVHIVGHLNKKPFECSLCSYKSNWRWDITKHIRIKGTKDSDHVNARVLMTDETGRRNYSKYNKYIVEMNVSSGHDSHYDENQGDSPRKKKKLSHIRSSEQPDFRSSRVISQSIKNSLSVDVNSSSSSSQSLYNNNNYYNENLLKIHTSTTNKMPNLSNISVDNLTSSIRNDETRQWRCKICDYRSPNKQSILQHVSAHYGTLINQQNPAIIINNTTTTNTNIKSSSSSNNIINNNNNIDNGKSLNYKCDICPFISKDESILKDHKKYHLTNLGAVFKCFYCPFYVNKKALLLEHAVLHNKIINDKDKTNQNNDCIKTLNISLSSSSSSSSSSPAIAPAVAPTVAPAVAPPPPPPPPPSSIPSGSNINNAPPILLDTRALSESPMVWVSRNNGEFLKMLKCRYCPYISSRRANVRDHETMHSLNLKKLQSYIRCTDCSFSCQKNDLMDIHKNIHKGVLGTVHCLVDNNRNDKQQLDDLKILLGINSIRTIGKEPDVNDARIVFSCYMCPAIFLYEKELNIHLRAHSNKTSLAYTCEWCTYTARQELHLQSHYRVHADEYQVKTHHLQEIYGWSQRYPPPMTACVETNKNDLNHINKSLSTAWIVVEPGSPNNINNTNHKKNNYKNNNTNINSQEKPSRSGGGRGGGGSSRGGIIDDEQSNVFKCEKCPSKYFKIDALNYHKTLHGSNNHFKCQQCDYASKTSQNLIKHQVVHRRYYQTIAPNINNHNNNHHNESHEVKNTEKLNDINIQNNIINSTNNNNNSVIKNTDDNVKNRKIYKCKKCPAIFNERYKLKVHLSTHSLTNQRFKCDKCDYSSSNFTNYTKHITEHDNYDNINKQNDINNDDNIVIDEKIDVNIVKDDDDDDNDNDDKDIINKTSRKSISSSDNIYQTKIKDDCSVISNQDKQSILLMQIKNSKLENNDNKVYNHLKCHDCPYVTNDKDLFDLHKRRHRSESQILPCPHCNYVPKKDENINEHIKLHFTRLYKPEGYLVIDNITLNMKLIDESKKSTYNDELLFRQVDDHTYLPYSDFSSVILSSKNIKDQQKIMIDPNTGETTNSYRI